MAMDSLPEDGELRLGAVMLPAGRRIVPMDSPGEPVAWVTGGAPGGASRCTCPATLTRLWRQR